MRRRFQRRAYTGGFTIIELLVAIGVIAVLAVITVVAYRGATIRAHDAMVAADLGNNTKKLSLAMVGAGGTRLPTGVALASSEYKITLSQRSVYAFYGYCTGVDYWGGPITEVIETAGTSDGKQFVYSSVDGYTRDVTSQMGTSTYSSPNTSSVGYPFKCWDFMKPGRIGAEFRALIHADGGVETGYVTILNNN